MPPQTPPNPTPPQPPKAPEPPELPPSQSAGPKVIQPVSTDVPKATAATPNAVPPIEPSSTNPMVTPPTPAATPTVVSTPVVPPPEPDIPSVVAAGDASSAAPVGLTGSQMSQQKSRSPMVYVVVGVIIFAVVIGLFVFVL